MLPGSILRNLRTTIASEPDKVNLTDTESPALITSSALCLIMTQQYEEAMKTVKRLLEKNRKNPNAIILAALILEHQGIHIPLIR